MGALKVTEFDIAAALDGSEVFGFVQAAENVQVTLDDITGYIVTQVTGGSATLELIRDTVGATLVGGIAVTITVDDPGDTITIDAIQEWAPNWNDDFSIYIPASEVMTIDEGNAPIGIGDLDYQKSTAGAPSTFNATSLPVTLQAGAWLKVTASSVDTFLAAHLVRTA